MEAKTKEDMRVYKYTKVRKGNQEVEKRKM
jgi:hypothetical protein